MRRFPLSLLAGLALALPAPARQAAPADTLRQYELAPVVVTATRAPRHLEDVAVPVSVVTAEALALRGRLRLADALAELPGLTLVYDHGTGIQIQGFDPDYTLVLIDGEPVIGRTAGTLDLERLAVAGLERVEIVRGPTSSLYGNEALAGVINLITRPPEGTLRGNLSARYGTHASTDLQATAETGNEHLGLRLLLDRYASDGYDLDASTTAPTAPAFTDYTADLRFEVRPRDGLTLRLGARLNDQDQQSPLTLTAGTASTGARSFEERTDWSLHPAVRARISRRLSLEGDLYLARYRTESRLRLDDGTLYSQDRFDQRYAKAELQGRLVWDLRHLTTLGAGLIEERLDADRYAERPEARAAFAFLQHEWLPSRLVELNASARLDAHTDYATRVSPKLAVLLRPSERLRVRLSLGKGFKAPDFRQRYLSFTNPTAGYSVLGATELNDGLAALEAAGQIQERYLDPAGLATIRAEHSTALNAGLTAEPLDRLSLSLNVFYNDVRDLIETQPVARKTNGSFVYSYFNLNRIYTRGLESEVTFTPWPALTLTGSYQFLQAHDRDVIEAIEDGRVFGRDASGRDVRLRRSDYGGLFGRSTHSGTLGLSYRPASDGPGLSLRGIWRGRYGYRDVDGNAIPNRDDEFVDGYVLWNLTVTYDWRTRPLERLRLQAGVDNLFDVTRPAQIPALSGRRLYAGFQIDL
ncbi:MAG: TonB-dependent receptor [Bacteroidetes bacterium]|nr:MAG: TonB-dependent receptor [Bacteroidota bacterium]